MMETTRGDGVIGQQSYQTGKQPTKRTKSKTKKMANAYFRIKGASCYYIDTNIVQLPNHDWTLLGSL